MKQKVAKRRQHIDKLTRTRDARAKLMASRQARLEQAIKAKEEQACLAAERQQYIEELTRAHNAQAELASDRQTQLVQLGQLQEAQAKLMAARQARLEQAIKAKEEQACLAVERQQYIEELTRAHDVQAKLASDRQTQLAQLCQLQEAQAKLAAGRQARLEQAIKVIEKQGRLAIDLLRGTVASSLQPRQVFRSETRWGRSVIEWPSLDAFLATEEVQSGAHSVPIGEFVGKQINFDFLLTARPGTSLMCHFHGNAPREGTSFPPVFTGLGVTSSIATSMFVPSDPALVLDPCLTLGWHFGCDGIRHQAITVSIIKKLQVVLYAPRVVTWGGSGGGFAAIRVAKDILNSIALVWNPQTNIAKYSPDQVNHYRRVAFPTLAADRALPSDREQFPSLYTHEFIDGYKGRILYLQESTDWHVNAHLKPFLNSFCKKALADITNVSNFSGFLSDQLYLHLDHWGNGHVPPSKDVISRLLSLLSDVTYNLEHMENSVYFPDKVIEYNAPTSSQHVPATTVR